MKLKFLLLTMLFLGIKFLSEAQVASYVFSQSSGTYTEITGGTVLGTDVNDDEAFNGTVAGGAVPQTGSGFPIGFNFTYNGIVCDKFAVNNNGYIVIAPASSATFAASAAGGNYTPLSTAGPVGLENAVAGLGRDLQGTAGSGSLTYLTTGAVGSRVLTVQWKSYKKFGTNGTGDNYNFQIRLLETTNVVETRYGTVVNNANGATPQVGLRGATNADFNNRTTTTTWAPSTAGATNGATMALSATVFPATGAVYTWTPPPTCTGAPTGGSAVALPILVCAGVPTVLSVTGATSGLSGLTYQWQSSPTGANTFTNIVGAVNATLTTTITASTDFRRITTCVPSASSANSSLTTVTLNVVTPTYAALPYAQNFDAAWVNGCSTGDRPDASWLGTPSTSDSSWRRNDDGATANWSSPTFGTYTPASQSGAFSARFHAYFAGLNTKGSLDIYFNGASPDAKQLTFFNINPSGTDVLDVLLSTNGGTTFTNIGTYGVTTAWTLRTINLPATTATSIIRFRGTADFGADDIGIDNLNITLNCVGTPNSGLAATNNSTVCPGASATLSTTGTSTGAGITYQWQSSPVGAGTFTNIVGATATTYTFSPVVSADYRLVVTCTASGFSANTQPVTINYVVPSATYATVPFNESFESWTSTCATTDRPTTNWLNNPFVTDSSWRRHDQGMSANWNNPTLGLWGAPVAQLGNFAARFHSYNAAGGRRGNLDVYYNAANGQSNVLTFFHINTSGTDVLRVLQSTDAGVTFTQLASFGTATTWTLRQITLPGNSATSIIRFQGVSDFGSTDIGIDNVNVAFQCTGTPVAGTATSNLSNVCPGGSANLILTGSSNNIGLTWQWQSSPVGANTYTNITGATSFNLAITPAAGLDYRIITTCTASALSATSAPVTVTVGTTPSVYATLPYVESFESWSNGCGTADRPGSSWNNSPFTTDSSWRRDDQGATANWRFLPTGFYTPSSRAGLYSARFHSYGTPASRRGNLDVFFNGASTIAKTLNFFQINPSGTDVLNVLLSTNGGTTFTQIGTYGVAAAWTLRTITIPTTTATSIIRFQGVSDFGNDDIGIDSVAIQEVCVPIVITAPTAATTTTLCVGQPFSTSVTATGTTPQYVWNFNGTPIAGAPNSATYSLAAVTTANAGTYTATVSNACTNLNSSNAILVVNASTAVTTNPADQTFCLGNNAIFNAAGSGLLLAYQWQVSVAGAAFTNITGATAPSYGITMPAVATTGNKYRCVITGTCGSATTTEATLTVYAPPAIVFTNVPSRVCLTDTIIQLSATPAGGSWSGPTVTGNTFFGALAGPGNAVITYVNTNGFGCTSTLTKTVAVEDCLERHNNFANGIKVYSNPNNGSFNVKILTDLYKDANMQITDEVGRILKQINATNFRYGSIIPIDIRPTASGAYFIKIFNNADKATFKFLIQK